MLLRYLRLLVSSRSLLGMLILFMLVCLQSDEETASWGRAGAGREGACI